MNKTLESIESPVTDDQDWWQIANDRAVIAARRVPPAEWHMEAKLDRPDMVNIYASEPRYARQHFIEVGTYDARTLAEITIYLGADGQLYTWVASPVNFMALPQTTSRTQMERIAQDLAVFYKLSDEHDQLYAAIITELERISDWRLFARTGTRYYTDVFTGIHRVGDKSRRLFNPDGEADYYDHLRVASVDNLFHLIDEKGRLVQRSRHTGRLTVVEPCEIFELSELRSLLARLQSVR